MQIELRDPKKIMKLKRLGSFHQSKLSFLRSFLREFYSWDYKRELFELDNDGYGVAVYSFKKEKRKYSLVCFANKLDDNERSDRVIATKWDASFTLFDGIPTKKDIERLSLNVPRQEIGRMTYKELTLSRANKSMRAFNYVVECLSNGNQPSTKKLSEIGYLYRTTAVYGSGKFGLADRFRIKNRPEIHGPFRLEMMLVYFVRQFTIDQVNFISKNKNPRKAIELDKNIARSLGIGNSTGLGMAPFIVNHPILLNNWILARETALKKIREIKDVKQEDFNYFFECLKNSINNINTWNTDSDYQKEKIKNLKIDLIKFIKYLEQELDKKKEPTKDRWIKVFGKAKFPSHDCKYCMQTHAHWAYNNYRTASLKNRETKNNGGLKKIIIQPAKKTIRPIKKNIKPLPKEIYNYVYYRDISSLMIFDKGILIHDWKRDYIFNNKPINGESRSKSIVGVAALKMSCQGILDLKKTHRYYSPKIKDSYF